MNPAAELRRLIREQGPISFAQFMATALYGEGGYYRRDPLPIGEEGDFVTGSSLSPLFGRATGRLLRRLDAVLGAPADYLEVGYGGGEHLAALIEVAGTGRRVLAHDRHPRRLPPGAVEAGDLDVWTGALDGLVFSYELFDALPVHRLVGRQDGAVGELLVALDAAGERFEWSPGPLTRPELALLLGPGAPPLAPGQVADVAPGWGPLYRQLARSLRRGLLVTCDYGFERPQLLDPRTRRAGTAAAYRRQRVHRDVLRDPGAQDLTAHVDFTCLREAGEEEGLQTVAFTRQARWLAACGIFEDLTGAAAAVRLDAMRLLDGEGMGEEIRVLVQARGLDPTALLAPALLR